MAGDRPEPVDGAAAGSWIVPALDGDWGGQVKNLIPQIYEAYARIFHPVDDEEGNAVTWAEVARRLGKTAHPEMQWHAIVGSYDPTNFADKLWSGDDPWLGELPEDELRAITPILDAHTGTVENVLFGLSTISAGVRAEWPDAPLHEQTSRDWVILEGPLGAVEEIAVSNRHFKVTHFYPEGQAPPPDYEPPEHFMRESPNLIWPEDRAWFVASEVDFDSTLIGGSRALIDALLASPDLEVLEVDPEVSLTADADKLNPVPDPPPAWDQPQDPQELTGTLFAETFEMLSGTVAATSTDGGVLSIDVEPDRGSPWRIEADHATWSTGEVDSLAGGTIARVGIDPGSSSLRLTFGSGATFEVTPRPADADDPKMSWSVEMPRGGPRFEFGPDFHLTFPDDEWSPEP